MVRSSRAVEISFVNPVDAVSTAVHVYLRAISCDSFHTAWKVLNCDDSVATADQTCSQWGDCRGGGRKNRDRNDNGHEDDRSY